MKKVLLVFEKHYNRVFDISDIEKEQKVYLGLFNERYKENYYTDLVEVKSNLLIDAKRKGDWKSAKIIILMRGRGGYEYQRADEMEVEEIDKESQ